MYRRPSPKSRAVRCLNCGPRLSIIPPIRGRGGIGRRARFRFLCPQDVQVRFLSAAFETLIPTE